MKVINVRVVLPFPFVKLFWASLHSHIRFLFVFCVWVCLHYGPFHCNEKGILCLWSHKVKEDSRKTMKMAMMLNNMLLSMHFERYWIWLMLSSRLVFFAEKLIQMNLVHCIGLRVCVWKNYLLFRQTKMRKECGHPSNLCIYSIIWE